MPLKNRKLARGVSLVGAGMSKFGSFPDKSSRDLFVEAFQDMENQLITILIPEILSFSLSVTFQATCLRASLTLRRSWLTLWDWFPDRPSGWKTPAPAAVLRCGREFWPSPQVYMIWSW